MTGVVPGGGATTGPEATVCNSSANETEGVRGRDLREVTTGSESPVGAERAQTIACRTEGVKAAAGI
jgi:hypothetical protein